MAQKNSKKPAARTAKSSVKKLEQKNRAKNTVSKPKTLSASANRERKKKEVATKLRHLGPAAKAEVQELVDEQLSKQFNGFTDFLREQSVIGVGIGLVFGTQIKTVVDTIMKSFVNPVTSLFLPGQEALADKAITLHAFHRTTVIGWGAIAYQLFSFIMVALIVYAAYKLLKLDKLAKKKEG